MRKNQNYNGSSTTNNTNPYSNCLSMLLMNNSRQRQVDYVTRSRGTFSSHSSKESLERQIKSKLGATPKKNGSSSPQIQPLRNYSNSLFATSNSIASSGIRTRVPTGSSTSQTSGTFAHAFTLFNSHPLPDNAKKVSSQISDNSSQIIQLSTSQWNSPTMITKTIPGDTQTKEQVIQIHTEQLEGQSNEETKQVEKKDIADLVRQVNVLEMKLEALEVKNKGEQLQENKFTVKPEMQKILLHSTGHIPGQCKNCKDHNVNEKLKISNHDNNHHQKSGNFDKAMISLETIPILQTTYQGSSLSSASSPFHNVKNQIKTTSKQYMWINEQQGHEQNQQQQHILTEDQQQITAQHPVEQQLSNENSDQLKSLQNKISELEAVIGCKNLEVLKLKEQLYQTKDSFIHKTSNHHLSMISEHKRRSSFSSSSELIPLGNQIHTKFVQRSIMEWGYSIRCQGGLNTLVNSGWKVQQNESKGDLSELRQVVGVIGMAHTGKTTLINGIMKGSLQTVDDVHKVSVFESKLNIVQDDSLAIFEYTLKQPISRKNIKEYSTQTSILGRSMEEVFHQGQRESAGNLKQASVGNSNKNNQIQHQTHPFTWSCSQIDELWLEFFIQKTPTLVLVIDKFTSEEQKLIREIFTRLQSANQLSLKELIIVHNYFGKGLRSAEELQAYFSESLQYIDENFKAKSIVDLKMYRTLLVQEQTKSKKCLNVSHILNGNLFDPFAEKYQHNTLAYCMERFSQAINPPAHFISSFEEFLNQRIGVDGGVYEENNLKKEQNVRKLEYNVTTGNLCLNKK